MFKNPKEPKTQFLTPLIKKFLGKGYICEEIVEKEVTIVRLRHNIIARFSEQTAKFNQSLGKQ
jgi:hypothetical protein